MEKFPLQLDANRDGPREVVVDVQIGSKAEAITSLHDVPRHGSVEVSLTAPMLDVFQQTSDYWIRSLSETPPPDAADAHCLASQQFASGQEQVTELCSDLNLHNDLPQFQAAHGLALRGVGRGVRGEVRQLLGLHRARHRRLDVLPEELLRG